MIFHQLNPLNHQLIMGIFKKRNEYFYESFVELSTLSLNTYECLVKGIKEFNHDNILELKNSVHELEH